MYQDETLICEDCGCEFVFTAGEQEFYAEKGLTNKPKRCANCRKIKKQMHRGKKRMHDAVCAKCGKQTQVPFNPTQGRDVLCKECFDAERLQRLRLLLQLKIGFVIRSRGLNNKPLFF